MRRLRLQLIGLLVLAVLLPVIPAALTVKSLLERGIDPITSPEIAAALDAGVSLSRDALEEEKRRFSLEIESGGAVEILDARAIGNLPERQRESLTSAAESNARIAPERANLAGIDLLIAARRDAEGRIMWFARPLPAELVGRAETLAESKRLIQIVRRERGDILRGFLASFLLIYGVALAVILALGLVLASRLLRPLQTLGEGIRRVSGGEMDTRVAHAARGEMGDLLRRFDEMVDRLKLQQEDLVRLEKIAAWRRISRHLAHEIKNPLTPIQLAAQNMRDSYTGGDSAFRSALDESVSIIEEEVGRLRALVAEFSEFGRLPEPRMQRVDPSAILADLVSLYGTEKLIAEAGTEGRAMTCDPEQIRRALINLIDNALAAQERAEIDEPVRIEIDGPEGGWIGIRVLDRGPGVPAEQRRRIFEPDMSTKPGGMGLGLAIVEGTAKAHGGDVAVEDRDGGGAVFVIRLPAETEGERA